MAAKVCGVDLVPEMADRARGNPEIADVQVAGDEPIPYGARAFDRDYATMDDVANQMTRGTASRTGADLEGVTT